MGRKRCREASLKVFSGREASLNLIIFLILYPKGKLLASYDIFKEVERYDAIVFLNLCYLLFANKNLQGYLF